MCRMEESIKARIKEIVDANGHATRWNGSTMEIPLYEIDNFEFKKDGGYGEVNANE